MKKTQTRVLFLEKHKKWILMTSHFFLFCFLFTLNVSAVSLGQKVTLEKKDASLKNCIISIEKQTQMGFLYNAREVDKIKGITISVKDSPLNEVLDKLLQHTGFTYEVENKVILLLKNEEELLSEITIKGKVTDSEGKPLPGATILIKGTFKGITTNADGEYSITVPGSKTVLFFSFLGFKSQEIEVGMQTTIDVVMQEEVAELGEVIIMSTGYQEIPKERATGSFAQVDNKLFNRSVSTDIITRLKNVVPGLLFDERRGEAPSLNIRGRSTIFANANPLIVVDGFPYEGELSNINPNDIESVTVLKDAAAASIWGVKAGNGVIVVVTKKGMYNQPLQININSNITFQSRPNLFYEPKISSTDFIDFEMVLFNQGYYDDDLNDTEIPPALTPVVRILASERDGSITAAEANAQITTLRTKDVKNDIRQYFYRPTVKQQYAVSAKGGGEDHNYYFFAGLDKNLLAKVDNDFNRLNLNGKFTFLPTQNLKISTDLHYTHSTTKTNATTSILYDLQNIYPYAKLADDEGNALPIEKTYGPAFIEKSSQLGLLDWTYVPVDELKYTDNHSKRNELRATFSSEYITPLKGLKVEMRYLYEKRLSNSTFLQNQKAYAVRDLINRYTDDGTHNIPLGDILTVNDYDYTGHSGRIQLNYHYMNDRHELTALAGVEVREGSICRKGNRYYGYDDYTATSVQVNYDTYYTQYPSGNSRTIPNNNNLSETLDRYRSYYVNAGYTYSKRYSLSVSARIDQSNIFGVKANQKAVPLWSLGAKWDIHKEKFFNVDWLPILRLRTSYGFNGNLDNTVTAFTTAYYGTAFYTGRISARISNPPNPELRWEKIAIFNLGVDFELKDRLLWGSIEYYHKKGTDLIGDSPLNPTTGVTDFRANVANMIGSGIEMNISSRLINQNDFRWESNLLCNYTTDKITKYLVEPSSVTAYLTDASLTGSPFDITPTEGKPLFGIYSYKWAGLDPETGDPRGYLDREPSNNYSAVISATTFDDLVHHGRALPPVFGSFRNTFSYKNLALSFNIVFKFGYYFRRTSVNYTSLIQSRIGHSDYALRWQNSGDEEITNVPSVIYSSNTNRDFFYNNSEVLVEKGDHIRLQDVQLSYKFSDKLLQNLPFKSFEAYVYATNLGILWRANKHNVDPDYSISRITQTNSIVFPQATSVSFGMRMSF